MRIMIECRGGVVVAVHSDVMETTITEIFDWDDYEEVGGEMAESDYEVATAGLVQIS